MKFHRLSAVIRKETREILRDRVTLSIAFLFPVVMLPIFGYAISLEVEHVRLGVLDQDQTPASAELIDQFAHSRYFNLVRRFDSEWAMRESVQANEVKLVLMIPPGFYSEMRRKDAPQVQLLIDGTYSATSLVALNYGLSIVSRFQGAQGTARIDVQPRVWYNPSLRSVIYAMAEPVQLYTRLFPARYFVEMSRGISLKGASLQELWLPLAWLTAYTLAIFAAAVAIFRKKVA